MFVATGIFNPAHHSRIAFALTLACGDAQSEAQSPIQTKKQELIALLEKAGRAEHDEAMKALWDFARQGAAVLIQ